jgi:NADH-quinone oxidoreductase subunit N
MGIHDIYLISPELALTGLAVLVVALGLMPKVKGAVRAVALIGLLVPFGFSIALWGDVHSLAGGADTAFLNTLMVDKFALFFKFLILGVLALLVLASGEYMDRFKEQQEEFLGLVFLAATGLMLLPAAADLITVFVALELATLPVATLAAFLRSEIRSTEAGLKFLLLGAMSSAVLLYGFAFIYGATGTLRLVSMDPAIPTIAEMITRPSPGAPFGNYALMLGVALSVTGFGFKLSIVPFHMWTPDVYEGAPTPVGAFLAVASKAAAFAVVLRVLYTAFGEVSADWYGLFAWLAVVTMTGGNVMAMVQTNMKRLLGYSAIAHAGYMMIGLAAVAARSQDASTSDLGPSGMVFYLGAYAAMNLAAFFAVMAIANKTGSERIADFAGMAQRSPWLAGALAVALISLTGIPPTAGFWGKFFLFDAAANADLVWLVVVGAINSVISAYYYMRVVRSMYLDQPVSVGRIVVPVTMGAALLITTLAILALGLFPGSLFDLARTVVSPLVP